MQQSAWQLMLQAGLIVKLVLIALALFSVCSWAIIFYKLWQLGVAEQQSEVFVKRFLTERSHKPLLELAQQLRRSPVANVFVTLSADQPAVRTRGPQLEELRRSLRRYETRESERLYSYLTFLATTGSTTPFIGLLGTVWGIMNAFRGIAATSSASLAVVAPGIAEALIATAVGLFAAIPAVVAYNYLQSRARRLSLEMEDFSEELLDVFTRPV